MDYAAHLRETAQHVARMTASDFARDHGKQRIEDLIASDPIYAGLPDMVREEGADARADQGDAMQTLILLRTLAAVAGFAIGYFFGAVMEYADRLFDAYMDGMGTAVLYWPAEVWR